MEGTYYARIRRLFERLNAMHPVKSNGQEMSSAYGRYFTMWCYCETAQVYYLRERHKEAVQQVDIVIDRLLSRLEVAALDVVLHSVGSATSRY
jgi:hypothetical protein